MKKVVKKEENKKDKIEITASYKVNRSVELLEFLLQKCNTSRNNVKHLLSNHQVLVNGSVATQFNLLLAKDDEIKISKTKVMTKPVKAKDKDSISKPRVKLDIIYEDDDFIAINKPYGLLSVESDKDMDSAYSYLFKEMQKVDKNYRPYQLHRIDKETSGVLVFAKNVKIHSMLKLKWNDYVTKREYYALVEGKMEEKTGRIVSYLKENQNHLVYSTNDRSNPKAITNYEVVDENNEYSLLRVLIETGRKNQIRVAMHDLGHPIVKDDKYGYTKDPIKRLGLHASLLEFTHPVTKKKIVIKANMPSIFKSPFKGE